MLAFSLIPGFIFLLWFMIKCNKQRSVEGVFIKNFASIFFILTAVIGTYLNPEFWQFGVTVIVGGAIGMLGDIYLDQKWVYPEHDKQYLKMGFLTFGIGHLFYIGGMFNVLNFTVKDILIPAVIAVLVTVVNLILEKLTKQDYGKMRLIVCVYTLVLSFMMGTAFWAAIQTKQIAFIIYFIGGAFFLLSDVILSPMYFAIAKDKNTPANFILNHATYYIGQYLIALTPFLIAAE